MKIYGLNKTTLLDYPGRVAATIFLGGCNFRCPFCQNADIACAGAEDAAWRYVAPEEAVGLALRARDRGCVGVAYTYNEPLVGYEYVRDVGRLASEAGLANVLVSNGMVNEGPLAELLGVVDAANIDLKGFTQGFYDLAGGDLAAVKRTIETLAADPTCHLEVTTLVIPGLNDDEGHLENFSRTIKALGRVQAVELLPYHRLGKNKYALLGRAYALESLGPMSKEDLARRAAFVAERLGGTKVLF